MPCCLTSQDRCGHRHCKCVEVRSRRLHDRRSFAPPRRCWDLMRQWGQSGMWTTAWPAYGYMDGGEPTSHACDTTREHGSTTMMVMLMMLIMMMMWAAHSVPLSRRVCGSSAERTSLSRKTHRRRQAERRTPTQYRGRQLSPPRAKVTRCYRQESPKSMEAKTCAEDAHTRGARGGSSERDGGAHNIVGTHRLLSSFSPGWQSHDSRYLYYSFRI